MQIRPDRKLMDARRVGGVPGSRLVVSVFISLYCLFMMMPSHGAGIDDDDLLLLDFTMDRLRLASSVTAYTVGDRTVVSLAEAGAALEFPIVVDARSGLAKGWFIRETRTFALDVKQGFVEVEGKRSAISEREVMLHDDAIFVTPEVFSQWFPVTLNLNASALTIEVEPREALPVQERMARRRGGQQIATIGPAKLPFVDSPYRLLGPPVADVGLGYSIRRSKNGGEAITGLNYSTLVAGDIAWMDGRLYLSGTDKEALSDARFTLSRDNLGLPLGLRYIEIGDINPVSIPGMSYGGLERGVMIQGGGSPIGRDDLISGDSMNISGDALPGWDVELFQNGMRLGLQSVGQNGRYDFRDIQPVGGANEFELVFYGPSGERRTEKVTRYSGLEPDQPGSVRYQFSVSEKGRQLYEPSLDSAAYLSDRGSARMSAGIDVRVLPRLSLRGAWNSVVVNGERLNYQSLGFRTGWRDMTVGADAIRDPFGGTRWDASLQLPASATFFGFDARFSHTHFAKTVVREAPKEDTDDLQIKEYTGEYTDYDLKLSSRTGVTLNGPIGNVATRFSYFRNQEESRSSNQFSAGFTSRYSGVSFGNTLNYFQFGRDSNTGIQEDAYLGGNFFFSTNLHPLRIRGGVNYTIRPDSKVNQYFVDSNLRIANDMTMQFGVSHTPSTGITRYVSGLNWQLPQITLSPRIAYDSDGEYSGFLYASFSLAPRPDVSGVMMRGRSMADSGLAVARTFIDHDGSGTFTKGDEPLQGVTVRAPQVARTSITDADGMAYISVPPGSRATDVMLDTGSLPDADLTSSHAGNSVKPRPTAPVMIDFPVVPTGEIDGHVYALRNGLREPLGGVMIELRDGDGEVVDFKVSSYDGFFVFIEVPYDEYTLTLAGPHAATSSSVGVVVGKAQPVHTGINLISRLSSGTAAASGAAAVRPVLAESAAEMPRPAPAVQPSRPIVQATTPATPPAALPRAASANSRRDGWVQLGAFGSRENAQRHLDGLIRQGALVSAETDIRVDGSGPRAGLHRVLASKDGASAQAFCQSLKGRGVQCVTASP